MAIHTTDRCYNPSIGMWSEQATTKKRDFGSVAARAIPNIAAEDNAQQAMLQHYQEIILPLLDQLHLGCDHFYKMAQLEFEVTHCTLERHTSQLNVLERAKANKTVLVLDLPPFYNKKTVDTNMVFCSLQMFPGIPRGGTTRRP